LPYIAMSENFRCGNCGSTDVEICLPAWFDPKDLSFIEADEAAEVLAVFCNDCEEADHIIAPNGQIITGRW
jgi:hypothetical protein